MKQELLDHFYGNEQVKAALVSQWRDGRLPHAMLLEGDPGAGRKTLARLIAAAAVCAEKDPPCGECRQCAKALAGLHPDILLMDGAENPKALNVESIRQVRAQASIRPNEGRCRVFILADAQNMTVQAQNALLKVLEEPPANVLFLLTCDNRAKLLTTILSRAALFRLEPPGLADCQRALERLAPQHDSSSLAAAARAAGGNVGRAAASLHSGDARQIGELAERIARAAVEGTEYSLMEQLASLEGDRAGLSACLEQLKLLLASALGNRYRPGASGGTENSWMAAIPALQCRRIIDIIDEARGMLDQNMGVPLASAWLCSQIKGQAGGAPNPLR